MKNFSIALNIILVAAVAFLYFHVFSAKKIQSASEPKQGSVSPTVIMPGKGAIAYVELDSLYEQISYIKSKRKELEVEQKSIEADWQNSMRGLEVQRDNFMKKGSSITQEEAEKFQGEYQQEQQGIEARKQASGQKLSEKSYKFMDEIQKSLKEFLTTYNKEKNFTYILTAGTGLDYMVYKDSSLNITDDVVKGMNAKMGEK